MHNRLFHNAKRILPYLGLSALVGFLTAILGTAFKLGAEGVIHLSGSLYGWARQNPMGLPAVILGAAILGLVSSFLVSAVRSCKGGGIPTSVAAVRGMVSFPWLPSVLVLPFSALITFLGGLPLGTEGPCVQMGTAIGEGVVQCVGGKKNKGWRRYVMTGGASAGFSIATASPISAIFFSVEELHKRFSPLLLTGVSVSVVTAQITAWLFALLGLESGKMFHLPLISAIPKRLLFVPVLVGLICGLVSVLFTQCYHLIEKVVHNILNRISVRVLFPVLFAGICLVGCLLSDVLGTGHGLMEKLFETHLTWYLLILVFLVRAVLMMISNTAGVTGGVFLPTLAFGALIGSLCADVLIALGWMAPEHYLLTVVLGTTAFLSATSRIPLTACVFAVEALGGVHNILALIIAATVGYVTAEFSGVEDFTDAVIQAKVRASAKGTELKVLETTLTVEEDSFVVGKQRRDVLWPNCCTVVSVTGVQEDQDGAILNPGDQVTLRYKTHAPAVTAEELQVLVGSAHP